MKEYSDSEIAELVQAAREVLRFVPDPMEPHPTTMPAVHVIPLSPPEMLRRRAHEMEAQSAAVRTLRRVLDSFS